MHAKPIVPSTKRLAPLIAVLSFAAFWLLPFSPFLAMVALSQTADSTGWDRRLAVGAAILCALYTVALAGWITYHWFALL